MCTSFVSINRERILSLALYPILNFLELSATRT